LPANGALGDDLEELKLDAKASSTDLKSLNESSDLDFSADLQSQRSEMTAATEDNYPRESIYVK
jgi:hypothetical protein